MNHEDQQGGRSGASLISADRVRGTDVYNRQGERLGDIDSILIDKLSGKVSYVVMSFGGFLGLGERYHPLPWHVLSYDTSQGGYVVDLDRSQLEGAPHYSRDEADRFGSTDDDRQRVDSHYPRHEHRSPDYDEDTNRSRDSARGVMAAGTAALAAGGTGGGSGLGMGGGSDHASSMATSQGTRLDDGTGNDPYARLHNSGEITGSTGGRIDDGSLGTSGRSDALPTASGLPSGAGDTHSGGGMGLATGSDGLGGSGVLASALGHDRPDTHRMERHDMDRQRDHDHDSNRVSATEEPVGFYSPQAQETRNATDGDAHRPNAEYRHEEPGHRTDATATGGSSAPNGLRSDGTPRGPDEPVGFYSPEAQAERNARDGDTTGADGRLTVGLPPGGQDREVIDARQRELDAKQRDDLAALRDRQS